MTFIKVVRGDDARSFVRSLSERGKAAPDAAGVASKVGAIIEMVRRDGDEALRELASLYGDPDRRSSKLGSGEIESSMALVSPENKQVIETAAFRIRAFAEAIAGSIAPVRLDYGDFEVGINYRPVKRAACYVPAGRHPLPSTALMTAITARVAGVEEVCIFCPDIRPEIVFAGSLAGVNEFYQIGGAQAVAAAAFGTATVEPVDMIVGPGNAFVTEAKRQLQGVVGIDMLAGPSEICAIADDGVDPEWAALDLLSQAEHAPDALAYLLTPSAALAGAVADALSRRIRQRGLPDYIEESIEKSAIVVLDSLEQCCRAAGEIAPEHLLLLVENPDELLPYLDNYGALFKGYGSTVAFGDYMAGPNHTLPTGQTARFQGCLSPLTFLRPQSFISVPTGAPGLARETAAFASIEGLVAHGEAALARSLIL
ncbi:MAG: histidinol dehydrogenase [Candidatus Melainabacteria bacterium]|nr:histidinol dehydrogenase [Candidatus Melainabacteria bacterium]